MMDNMKVSMDMPFIDKPFHTFRHDNGNLMTVVKTEEDTVTVVVDEVGSLAEISVGEIRGYVRYPEIEEKLDEPSMQVETITAVFAIMDQNDLLFAKEWLTYQSPRTQIMLDAVVNYALSSTEATAANVIRAFHVFRDDIVANGERFPTQEELDNPEFVEKKEAIDNYINKIGVIYQVAGRETALALVEAFGLEAAYMMVEALVSTTNEVLSPPSQTAD